MCGTPVAKELAEIDVGIPPAADKHTGHQPPPWQLAGVQFLAVFAVAVSVPAYPYIWTYTSLANGDEVKGGSLHSLATTLNAVCELLTASLLGVLSDRYGRRPFLLLSVLGQALDFGVAALAANDRPDYALSLGSGHVWMFAARSIAGLTGGFMVFAKAAVGDVSTPETSARNFAMLIAMIGLAFVLGPPVGALLSRDQLQLPMLVSAALLLLDACFLVAMKEPLQLQHRASFEWRKVNPLGALQFLWSTRFLIVFAAMSFLDQFALVLLQTIILLYSTAVFQVSRGLSSSLLVVFGVGQALAYALVLRPVVRLRGEAAALELGYALTFAAFIALAVTSYFGAFWPMYICMMLLALGSISNPAESAIASCYVDSSEQGRLQAANACLDVVGKVTGSFGVYLIWEPTASAGQPGIVWWFAALVMVPGVVLSFRVRRLVAPRCEEVVKASVRASSGAPRADVCEASGAELGDGVVPGSGSHAIHSLERKPSGQSVEGADSAGRTKCLWLAWICP